MQVEAEEHRAESRDAAAPEAQERAVGTFQDTAPVPDHIREIMRENSRQLEYVTKKARD